MKRYLVLALSTVFIISCYGDEYMSRRQEMVKKQIEARGIKDREVLKAMQDTPRELFMPPMMRLGAYLDRPMPIGEGQTISQPYIVAYMSEALELKKSDRVLEIGTGSGYHAAVISKLVKEIYTIEIVESLGENAKKILTKLKYKNVHVKIGDGYKGWPSKAPFDAIILTAAPSKIPQPLIDQLKEGGRLLAPVGDHNQELILLRKINGKIIRNSLLPVRFVPMTGEALKDIKKEK